jgi:hypothetical protein
MLRHFRNREATPSSTNEKSITHVLNKSGSMIMIMKSKADYYNKNYIYNCWITCGKESFYTCPNI